MEDHDDASSSRRDFGRLAEACPSLAPHLVPRRGGRGNDWTIDFSREDSVEEVTKCILEHDYRVRWERPPRSLIPPVPNRFAYLSWLGDLLAVSSPASPQTGRGVRGVDIGTGGSLIYALLGASAFGWSFLATESCEYSLEWAARNLGANPGLGDLIEIRDSGRGAEAKYLAGVVDPDATYDFCMCNPPFFDTDEERKLHKAGHGGLRNEIECPGGESAFIGKIFGDSLALRGQIGWYTTMVGRKKNFKRLVGRIRAAREVKGIRTTTFVCGRTTRWGLAWTFREDRGGASQDRKRKRPSVSAAAAAAASAPNDALSRMRHLRAASRKGKRSAPSRGHSFMVPLSAGATALGLKAAAMDFLRTKLVWGASAAEVSVASPASDPFAFTCAFACSAEAISARFETTIFQYSKEIASVQSKMAKNEKKGRGGAREEDEEDAWVFQAICACMQAALV